MTVAGALILPSAPLLLPGVSERPPEVAAEVRAAIDAALAGLPEHDLRVLLAGAPAESKAGVRVAGGADLGGLSRPDIAVPVRTPEGVATAVTEGLGLPRHAGDLPVDLPVDLAVLALQTARAGDADTVALAVPWAPGEQLAELGRRLVAALPEGHRVLFVAAGDLSAGIGAGSPRPRAVDGEEWNAAAVAAVESGDTDALAALGPDAAAAAAARGWPALVVLAAALDVAGLRLSVRCTGAPRGVGYVVADA